MRKVILTELLAALGCAGCGASTPVMVGKDTYMLHNTDTWSWSSGDGLASDLFQGAGAFCARQNRTVMPMNVSTKDGGFSNFGHASLVFRCLADGDPELRRPNLRPVPNVRIENAN